MTDKKEKTTEHALPEIGFVDPKTKQPVMLCSPQPGNYFGIKWAENVTLEQYKFVIGDVLKIYYQNLMTCQRILVEKGLTLEEAKGLLLPGVPDKKPPIQLVKPN